MAQRSSPLSFRPDEDVVEAIETYQAREGIESRTEAVQEMIRVGARETRYPLLHRLKDHVTTWAGWLGVAAIVVMLAGVTLPFLLPVHAVVMAMTLIGCAFGLVGVYELARVVTGQSELGARVREVVR